jgi:hypothetical protein
MLLLKKIEFSLFRIPLLNLKMFALFGAIFIVLIIIIITTTTIVIIIIINA